MFGKSEIFFDDWEWELENGELGRREERGLNYSAYNERGYFAPLVTSLCLGTFWLPQLWGATGISG